MTSLRLPLLGFSVQAANNREISNSNPLGFTRQANSQRVADWAMKPDGCVTSDRLAELAPGCGWVADRVMGLVNGGYDIGPYAGEDGRRCDRVWPWPLTDNSARFAALADLSVLIARGVIPAVFVGSPRQVTLPDLSNRLDAVARIFGHASLVAALAAFGILTIFDTGGCVGPSDARDTFEELDRHGIPFYLEPTRPYAPEAVSTVSLAAGLVSTTERMRTMENETKAGTRAWFDTKYLEECGKHDVEWCTGISVQYAMERARLRLLAGRRVIVPLRIVTEDHIRQLQEWAARGLETAGATKASAAGANAAGKPDLKVGGGS